jgi:heptosyltransferase I
MGDSVRRMSCIVGASDLVLAPDTGPVHVARALGVPVIGIYGHTNPWRVGPWRAFEDLWVDHYTEGSPDPSRFEPKWNVMPTIRAGEVIGKVRLAVDKYQAGMRRGRRSS